MSCDPGYQDDRQAMVPNISFPNTSFQNISSRISFSVHKAAQGRTVKEQRAKAAIRDDVRKFKKTRLGPGRSAHPAARRRRPACARGLHGVNDTNGIARHVGNAQMAVIDDSPDAREGLHALILSMGYKCQAFGSAEDFLGSESKADTACLILDVHLPGMSGPDLQARLIADGHCIPIVFVSGRFEECVHRRVIAAGALGYLTKPYDESALLDCLERALNARG